MDNNGKTFWLPEKASTFVDIVDPAFMLYYWISVFFFVLICGLIIVFMIKYVRRRPEQLATAQITHNLPLELSWTIIPLIIVMILFFIGMKGYLHMRVPPADSMQVNVMGQKWSWSFTYPTGAVNDTLVVPVNTPVKLLVTSRDVLHSFFIPAFRTKADVHSQPLPQPLVPGHPHRRLPGGVHPVLRHQPQLHAHRREGAGAGGLRRPGSPTPPIPARARPRPSSAPILYTKRGCNACHSIDGSKLVGPSWKGVFGKSEATSAGNVRGRRRAISASPSSSPMPRS